MTTKFYAVSIPVRAVATFTGKADSEEHAKSLAKEEWHKNAAKYGDLHEEGEPDWDQAEIEELGYKPFNESW